MIDCAQWGQGNKIEPGLEAISGEGGKGETGII